MATAKWYIVHEGRKLLAETKAHAHALAQMIADKTGRRVTVRPVPRSAATADRRTMKRNPDRPAYAVREYVEAVREKVEAAGFKWTRPAQNMAVFNAENRVVSVTGAANLIITYLDRGFFPGSPYSGAAANKRFKRNPAPQPLRYVVRYLPKGEGRAQTLEFSSKATAEDYLSDFGRRGITASLTDTRPGAAPYKRNPDPGSFLPVWNEQEKGRRARLDYIAATKGRRLAKGLRGRDRGGAVKAHERGAQKTAKFQVFAKGPKGDLQLGRSSRRDAEAVGDQLAAAGYRVTIKEGTLW